jgi:hypothetical protein
MDERLRAHQKNIERYQSLLTAAGLVLTPINGSLGPLFPEARVIAFSKKRR